MVLESSGIHGLGTWCLVELEVGRLLTRVMLVGGYLLVPLELVGVLFLARLVFVGFHFHDSSWCPHSVLSYCFPFVGLMLLLRFLWPLGCTQLAICFVALGCPPLVATVVVRAQR